MDEIKLSQGYPQREAAEFADRRPRRSPAASPTIRSRSGMVMEARAIWPATPPRRWPPPTACSRSSRTMPARSTHQGPDPDRRARRGARSTDAAAWTRRAQLLAPRRSQRRRTIRSCSRLIIDSFTAAGRDCRPTDAQNALYTAMELAPSDDELRYKRRARFRAARHDPARRSRSSGPTPITSPHRAASEIGGRARASASAREDRDRQAGRRRGTRPRARC